MAIITNKPTSVSADSTTSLQLNKADLQAKLEALNAGAYWEDQGTWKGVAFLFENSSKQKVIVSFDASGNTANLQVSEFFVDGDIQCKRIDVIGFANDYYTIFREDFTTASEFDIEITDGYAGGGGNNPVTSLALYHFDGDGNDVYGNNLTQFGGILTYNPGKFSQGVSGFASNAAYLKRDASFLSPIGSSDFTIECWVKFTNSVNQQELLSIFQDPNPGVIPTVKPFNIYYDSSYEYVYVDVDGNQILSVNIFGTNDGNWHHLTIQRVGGVVKGYINGVLVSNSGIMVGDLPSSGHEMAIGFGGSSYPNRWEGEIDELRISNYAMYDQNGFTPPNAPFNETGGGGDVETPELIPNGNFEQGDLNWFFANESQVNKLLIGPATSYSGTNSLYVSQDNGLTATYSSNSPSKSFAWTHVNITETKPKIRIRMRVAGEAEFFQSFYDYLNVSVMYNPSNLSDASVLSPPIAGQSLLGGGLPFYSALIKFTPEYGTNWVVYEFDLSGSIVGTVNVRLLFNWVNDAALGSIFGAAVDSIEVVGENPLTNPLTWARTNGHTTEPDGGIYGGPGSSYWAASSQVIPSGQDGEFTFKVPSLYSSPNDFAFGIGPLSNGTNNVYFGVCWLNGYLRPMNQGSVELSPIGPVSLQGTGKNTIKISRQGSLLKVIINNVPFYQIPLTLAYEGELVAAVRTMNSSINTGIVAAYKTI